MPGGGCAVITLNVNAGDGQGTASEHLAALSNPRGARELSAVRIARRALLLGVQSSAHSEPSRGLALWRRTSRATSRAIEPRACRRSCKIGSLSRNAVPGSDNRESGQWTPCGDVPRCVSQEKLYHARRRDVDRDERDRVLTPIRSHNAHGMRQKRRSENRRPVIRGIGPCRSAIRPGAFMSDCWGCHKITEFRPCLTH